MRPLIRFAARIYPRPWRERYGEEFETLLDDVGVDGRVAFDVLASALAMQVQRWWKFGMSGTFVGATISVLAWWAGQRPYITPGTHQIFRMDSTLGFLVEFLVLISIIVSGLITFLSGRRRWICAAIAASYVAAIVLASLLTPRTIVSIGDSYCWDLWCVGIQRVDPVPHGDSVLYKAEVALSSDASTIQIEVSDQPQRFFFVTDEQGHRYPLLSDASAARSSITVKPGESVKSSFAFVAPANARRLYLTDDLRWPPWVSLYFGSDLNPFHRRTLLRVL